MTASTDFQAILSKLSGSSWAASKETVSGGPLYGPHEAR